MSDLDEKTTVRFPAHLSHSQASSLQFCGEEWRPVPGAEGYEVSNLGRARSYRLQKGGRSSEPHPIGEATDRQGYHVFKVGRYEGVWRVHRAVLHAFVGPPADGQVGRHLNDIKSDNRLENLAWGTQQENCDDRTRNGNTRNGRVEPTAARSVKLTWDQVREIRKKRAAGAKLLDLSRCYAVGVGNISLICLGRTWKED